VLNILGETPYSTSITFIEFIPDGASISILHAPPLTLIVMIAEKEDYGCE
jgi:hypothetical protein